MPVFYPTEYMYEKYKESKLEKSQIYAQAVREAMAHYGQLELTDM